MCTPCDGICNIKSWDLLTGVMYYLVGDLMSRMDENRYEWAEMYWMKGCDSNKGEHNRRNIDFSDSIATGWLDQYS